MGLTTLDQSYLDRVQLKRDIFKGKVVFVTGGAGSICSVQVQALVLLGADAAIVGRSKEKTEDMAQAIQSLRPGAKVLGIGNTDVREVSSLKQAVDLTVEKLGRIDFVICGAAGNFLSDFNHLSANAFKSVVSIDLLGSYNTVKAAYEQLIKNRGSLLFISTTLHYYGVPYQSHVSAAKAGIDALSNALAVELGPLGVKVNCLAPGTIQDTEGFDRLKGEKSLEEITKHIPLQRAGTKEDIANVTAFLFSNLGSYINGERIVVDGGAWHLGQSSMMDTYPKLLVNRLKATPKL